MLKLNSPNRNFASIFTFGIPIHDCQEDKPDEFSANVRYNGSEMRARISNN